MTMPSPGTTRYYRTPQGVIGEIHESHPGSTPLPDGAEEITAEEYATARDAWQAEKDVYIAGLEAAEAARRQEDYEALRAASIPEATARRLSGLLGEPA